MALSDGHLVIQWIDSDIQGWVVPLHLLSLLHVHLHRAPLSRTDARHAEYHQEDEESNADNGNHRYSSACHISQSGFTADCKGRKIDFSCH